MIPSCLHLKCEDPYDDITAATSFGDVKAMTLIVRQNRSTMWKPLSEIRQIIALPLRFGPHLRVNPRLKPNGLIFFPPPPASPTLLLLLFSRWWWGVGWAILVKTQSLVEGEKKGQQTWIKRIRAFLLHGAHYPEQMGFRESFSSPSCLEEPCWAL